MYPFFLHQPLLLPINKNYFIRRSLFQTGRDQMKQFRIFGFVTGLIAIIAGPAAAAPVVTVVTTNGSGVFALNDAGHVAYKGVEGGDFQVYLYKNGASAKITANNNANKSFIDYVKINNNDQIVWNQYDYSGDTLQVNLYLYSGGTIKKINTPIGTTANYCIEPQLNINGTVVWRQYSTADGVNNGSEIFLYNGSTIRVTTDANKDESPSINNIDLVAWTTDRRSASDWDQRINEFNCGDVSTICYGAGTGSFAPQIQADNSVFYVIYNSANTVSYYSLNLLANFQTRQIALGSFGNRPFSSCNGKAVFSLANKQMYLFNGSDTARISTSPYDNNYPCVNGSGHAAWLESDASGNFDRVVYYNAASVDSVCAFGAYSSPLINAGDDIVWSNDGSTIYLAHASTGVMPTVKAGSNRATAPARRAGVLMRSDSRMTIMSDVRGRKIQPGTGVRAAGVFVGVPK
jgi:hypothetical protein